MRLTKCETPTPPGHYLQVDYINITSAAHFPKRQQPSKNGKSSTCGQMWETMFEIYARTFGFYMSTGQRMVCMDVVFGHRHFQNV
jgi:hypothetical protein